ncbi:MAG: acyltransferase family protein [Erysipelotrichaceae bacterium]|nr:acyltransferase family protein [Erysipelotrichaceae bacterium]
MNQNKRLKYIDAAKGWGILMVAFGHITALSNPVDTYFSSYKLAIFFIISGYLLSMRNTLSKFTLISYIKKQFDCLILPYLGYSLIIILYKIIYNYLTKGITLLHMKSQLFELLYSTLTFRGISALWFIPSLFIGQILLYIVVTKFNKKMTVCSIIIPIIISKIIMLLLQILETKLSEFNYMIVSYPILTISKSIIAFFFLIIGYKSFNYLKKLKNKQEFILGLLLTLTTIFISQYNKGVDLNMMNLGNYSIMFYITGIIGSFGILLLFKYLEKHISFRFLSYCGNKSLIIMATHGTLCFKMWSINIYDYFIGISDVVCLKYYIDCLVILIILILFEFFIIKIVEHSKVLCGKYKFLSE